MRVEATTDSTNRAEQRALEKAGFTREGVPGIEPIGRSGDLFLLKKKCIP